MRLLPVFIKSQMPGLHELTSVLLPRAMVNYLMNYVKLIGFILRKNEISTNH